MSCGRGGAVDPLEKIKAKFLTQRLACYKPGFLVMASHGGFATFGDAASKMDSDSDKRELLVFYFAVFCRV